MALWQVCRLSGDSWQNVYDCLVQIFGSYVDAFYADEVPASDVFGSGGQIWAVCREESLLLGAGRTPGPSASGVDGRRPKDRQAKGLCALQLRGVQAGFLCSCVQCMARSDEVYMTDNLLQDLRVQDAESFFVLGTSATTGDAKCVILSPNVIAKSVIASYAALGVCRGAQWLLCLPVFYISGFLVLVRSVFAQTVPCVLEGRFDVGSFVRAAQGMSGSVRCVSLVPFQLQMLLGDADVDLVDGVMQNFAAILVGGQAVLDDVVRAALGRGWRVITTYGASETCGGCVYNSLPLSGYEVRTSAGNVYISGEGLACGYLRLAHKPRQSDEKQLRFYASIDTRAFFMYGKKRWYRTGDVGELQMGAVTFADCGLSCNLQDADTKYLRLRITGRADRVIVSGGKKVNLDYVASLVQQRTWLKDCVAVSVPSVWGESVVLAVVIDALSRRERMCGNTEDNALDALLDVSADEHRCVDVSDRYLPRVIDALADCPSSARPIGVCELSSWPLAKSGKIDFIQVSNLVRSYYDCADRYS